MRNYIKSEFYRIIHRRYYQLTILIFILLSLIGNLALKFWGTKITSEPFLTSMDVLIITMAASPFMLIILQNIILGDEIKNNTLNNAITNGVSRGKIVVSKVIITAIFSILFSIIVLGFHILMSIALFGGNEEGYRFISQYLMVYLSAIPLWIGLIAFYTIFSLTIQNQVITNFIIIILIFVVPEVISLIIYFKPKLIFLYQLQPQFSLRRLITLLEMGNMSSIDWLTIIYGFVFFLLSINGAINVLRKKDF